VAMVRLNKPLCLFSSILTLLNKKKKKNYFTNEKKKFSFKPVSTESIYTIGLQNFRSIFCVCSRILFVFFTQNLFKFYGFHKRFCKKTFILDVYKVPTVITQCMACSSF